MKTLMRSFNSGSGKLRWEKQNLDECYASEKEDFDEFLQYR